MTGPAVIFSILHAIVRVKVAVHLHWKLVSNITRTGDQLGPGLLAWAVFDNLYDVPALDTCLIPPTSQARLPHCQLKQELKHHLI